MISYEVIDGTIDPASGALHRLSCTGFNDVAAARREYSRKVLDCPAGTYVMLQRKAGNDSVTRVCLDYYLKPKKKERNYEFD